MIISIKELIEMCITETENKIPLNELMENYHLRFEEQGLSSPVNEIQVNTVNKNITLKFNPKNITKGMITNE